MAEDIGQGSYITFGTTLANTGGFKITSISHSGINRAVVDATHMKSTAKEFIGSAIYDPGELSVEVLFDPSVKILNDLTNAATSQVCNIYWANGNTTTTMWSAYGFISAIEAGAQIEEMMTGTVTIKLSGPLNIS